MNKDIIEIDLSIPNTPIELHRLLKEKLDFPHFYGNNWDAFWDSITGLVTMPKKLIFKNTENLKKNMPEDFRIMKSCLDDMEKMYPKSASKTTWS